MIKFLDLRDNALFLQNWRERMRGPTVAAAVLMASVIIMLIFLTTYFNREYDHSRRNQQQYGTKAHYSHSNYYSERREIPWLEMSFYYITYFQGVVLLLFGTISADRMAVRERASGTLEYHRCSPTRRLDQFAGLLLGSTCLEWCIVLGSLPISLFLVLVTEISLLRFFIFYLSLFLSAVFYHAFAVLLATAANQRSLLNHRRISAVHIVVVMLFASGAFMYSGSSALYHLSWIPNYEQLTWDIKGHDTGSSYSYYDWRGVMEKKLYSFFGVGLPSLVLQGLVQLPILIMFITGIVRQISKPDRPLFSKPQSALLIFIVLFLFTGSAYSGYIYGPNYSYSYSRYDGDHSYSQQAVNEIVPVLAILIWAMGVIGALSVTPTRLLFEKGRRKAKKLKLRLDPNDDHSSNTFWLATFGIVVMAVLFMFRYVFWGPFLNWVFAFILLMSHVVFFACAFEYVRLSKHHRKMILFTTVIVLLWFVLPFFSMALAASNKIHVSVPYAMMSSSPFWNIDIIRDLLAGKVDFFDFQAYRSATHYDSYYLARQDIHFYLALFLNLAWATAAAVLVKQERDKLYRQIVESPASSQPA
ncbi:MAG: hypothetical protein U1D99_10705 [Candidatus Omnitrophota bacterium]|nr:hypothetical protein [Candidatus Omnitrophota bacterium]